MSKFQIDDTAVIHSTAAEYLDGLVVTISGISAALVGGFFYIIDLPHRVEYRDPEGNVHHVRTITLTEHCLRPVI